MRESIETQSMNKLFEDLYQKYFELIYKFIYRLLENEEQAIDITQESFIRLLKHLNKNSEIRNPKSWLYRVSINLCNDHIKREKIYQRILHYIKNESNVQYNIESDLLRKEKTELVQIALKRIPVRDQLLLQLYQDGLSYAEIAEALKLKKASVGKLLTRAIEKCTKSVEELQ